MASIPYLSRLVETVVAPVWSAAGADPALAATTFIASDMGGYQLAQSVAESDSAWIMAMVTGFMAGATIVFSIPSVWPCWTRRTTSTWPSASCRGS